MVSWLRRLLLTAVLGAACWYLAGRWDQVARTLRSLSPAHTVASQLAVFTAMVVATYGWQVVVDALGEPVGGLRGGQVYLVGQLGKYLPGSVWAYLLQAELGHRAGMARARVFTASLVQLAVSLMVALALGIAALPLLLHRSAAVWLVALLPLGVAAVHPKVLTWGAVRVLTLLRRPLPNRPFEWRIIGMVAAASAGTYLLYGLHLWLLAGSSGAVGVAGLLLCTGAMAVGLNAGLLLFVLPSGAGLRDVVVAAALATAVGPAQAAAFAVVSRVMFIVGDLATAGAAAALARWRTPLPAAGQ
ncbi:MAG TPA: lysylphosphatidylglycerol synthase domain-containing protein [Pseudonocardiaceae bacterium]|nr:lysylphosphatidylglycerol synthase domain-containing protein [Pseudonocardiaceae bacterium]